MSGIIGKLSFDRHETLARAVLEQMLDASRRRGTRNRGIYTAAGIALGWCADDDVPVPDAAIAADERPHVRVVADSVLSNGRDLRAQLERLGHAVATATDADVMAHAYQQWGDACVERFRGAFACAIWDEHRRRLLLARDHAGIRPLYFAFLHGHGVVFASDVRALLQDPGVGRECCPAAIDAYLALGYVPAPLTAYRRVSKLEPAQRVIVEGRGVHVDQYWDLPEPERRWGRRAAAAERLTPEIGAALERTLRQAIRRDTSEAGANGTLYSGGLGSAGLLAAGAAQAGDVVIVANGRDTIEAAPGFDVARRLDCDLQVETATADPVMAARELASRFDDPIADPLGIAQHAIYAAARPHTSHALAGHGAAALWTASSARHGEAVEHAIRLWTRATDDERRVLYTRAFAWAVRDANPFARHLELYAARDTGDPVERALYVDARTSLPDSTLAIAERAAMAAGLRLSFPYLDRDAMELAARVPTSVKQQGAGPVPAVRALLERHVPSTTLPPTRPAAPSLAWLHDGIAAMAPSLLLSPRFDGRGIVSRPALQQLWDEHVSSGRRDHARRLWSLLMLELWFREYIDGDATEQPLEYAALKAA